MTKVGTEEMRPIDVHEEVRRLRDRYMSIWEGTPPRLPDQLRVYDRVQQEENEARLLRIAEERRAHSVEVPAKGDHHRLSGRTLRRLVKLSLAYAPSEMKDFMPDNEAFIRLTDDFIQRARSFDPGIAEDSLMQALRNIWVFCSLQRLGGRELELTPSAFAYSMLYPYSDNLLDDGGLSGDHKKHFAHRVGLRLKGFPLQAVESIEERVFSLIGMIEREFPRSLFPSIHQSLEAIHRAQRKSTAQQRAIRPNSMLPVTLEKGGTSVLADAFLAGVVTDEAWFEVSFSYGCLLQLIDDLQDIDVDCEHHSRTLFSIRHSPESLQALAMRLLGFIDSTITGWDSLCSTAQDRLKSLMKDSCQVLVLEAIARRSSRFAPPFLRQLERHAPTRMTFLASLREQFPGT